MHSRLGPIASTARSGCATSATVGDRRSGRGMGILPMAATRAGRPCHSGLGARATPTPPGPLVGPPTRVKTARDSKFQIQNSRHKGPRRARVSVPPRGSPDTPPLRLSAIFYGVMKLFSVGGGAAKGRPWGPRLRATTRAAPTPTSARHACPHAHSQEWLCYERGGRRPPLGTWHGHLAHGGDTGGTPVPQRARSPRYTDTPRPPCGSPDAL